MSRGRVTLRRAVEAFAPIAKALRGLERDARGIGAQYAAIPHKHEGPEKMLDRCQAAVDRGFEQAVGTKLLPDRYAAPEVIRDVLHAIERLADLSGAKIDTAELPLSVRVWTDDPNAYFSLGRDDPARERADSKFRLAERVRLNSDGSRRSRK
jgi:uncharacterized protein (DUF2267 family)